MNKWIIHCKDYHKKHPNMKWKDVLKSAKSTYTKVPPAKAVTQKGKGIMDDLKSDFMKNKLGSKALDYLSNKVKTEGY